MGFSRLMICVASLVASASVMGQEAPINLLAIIREQGYSCTKPISTQNDSAHAAPGEVVWVVKCEGATYRITLTANKPAQVERSTD